ncbi:MAG: DUF3658 domain-containing protein [Lachnospiraceae bacterium]|nr:DUF3658 domain-containing protein [Lachnospiraceae bacterium]
MIEVLFGESEAGSMKCAKSNQKICHSDGPTAVFGNTSSTPFPEEWIPVPGLSSEVICLPYMLDIGNIQEPFDSSYRQDLILSMYTQSGWDTTAQYADELRKGIAKTMLEYPRLLKMLETEQTIRVWFGRTPYSLCGFYWLCAQLFQTDCEIFVVELPEHKEEPGNVITSYQNWGDIPAEEWSSFLPLQRKLTRNERKMYAHTWMELVEDNSPLRAVINQKLTGVPEYFYDFLIKKRITEKPVREARLIGDILGLYQLSIGDWWYALRIEQMIQSGEICVLADSEQKYQRLLKRNIK